MAYRIALAGAIGPFVGPWIRATGTEYAIELRNSPEAVIEFEKHGFDKPVLLDIRDQLLDFPPAVSRYRVRIDAQTSAAVSVRVHLK